MLTGDLGGVGGKAPLSEVVAHLTHTHEVLVPREWRTVQRSKRAIERPHELAELPRPRCRAGWGTTCETCCRVRYFSDGHDSRLYAVAAQCKSWFEARYWKSRR